MQASGTLASSPRDNIVFEVGFFAARMGMENTLLIVEQGAKLPSDWGGILYIPLKDRADISGVKMMVYSALKNRFCG
jgi:predicted nucleotide-binding protein